MKQYSVLLAAVTGWLIAQTIKYVVYLRKDGIQFNDLFASGGFPSSHTAFVVSATTYVGLLYGLTSDVFAVLAIVSGLVMYDAVGVRRSSGEQALAIKELALKTGKTLSTRLHAAKGHTPLEVLGGVGLGAVVGLGFYLFN